MNHIDQCLRWDPTPLAARAALALSRVLQPLNPVRSTALRNHAQNLAFAVGEIMEDPGQVPALLMDEEWLVQGFKEGCKYAAHFAAYCAAEAYAEEYLPTVWQGDWRMDSRGIYETRACVAETDDGFLPGLEVSQRGGDCEPSYGEPVATLDQAIEIANDHEFKWHVGL